MTVQRYLSLRQVQAELGLFPDELDLLIRSGRLPAFRIANNWRVDRLMLERLVDDLFAECEPALRSESKCGAPGVVTYAPRDDPQEHLPGPAPVPWQRSAGRPSDQPPDLGLTEQQQRIVRLIGEGMSNAEVARRLSVEVSTVKSHVSRVLQRLDLRDREQLIAHVWRSGVMDKER